MHAWSSTTVLLALMVAASGCGHGPQFGAKLQTAGVAASLKQECAGFIRVFEQSGERQDLWMSGTTNFPPAIAAFQPQFIRVTRMDGVNLIEVQVSGGFSHQGLFVAPSSVPSDFQPTRRNWRVWKLADGVWEYHE